MWVVADLDDEYIAKMEDVLKVYERPYNAQEPRDGITNMNAAGPPMSSVL